MLDSGTSSLISESLIYICNDDDRTTIVCMCLLLLLIKGCCSKSSDHLAAAMNCSFHASVLPISHMFLFSLLTSAELTKRCHVIVYMELSLPTYHQ